MWFAFEIYIFDILIQHREDNFNGPIGCDLLSKFISLIFWYNRNSYAWWRIKLWFAFEIYIFDILIQPQRSKEGLSHGCDLLSKFISLIFWYNEIVADYIEELLWFAFEIYIFDILIQHKRATTLPLGVVICFRNLYLWYSDTTQSSGSNHAWVVICFRNLYLWYSDTTNQIANICHFELWFAFEIYIFDILIQRTKPMDVGYIVVICFRNLYLWYSDTTEKSTIE